MNDPNNPFDELHFDNEQDRRPSGFGDLELRLKQFRPRPPQIDIVAIEKEANRVETLVTAPTTHFQGVKRYSASQFAGTIACSWICGVLVGAVCVLFFTSTQKPFSHDIDRSAASDLNQDTDRRIVEIPPPIQSGNEEMDRFESKNSAEAGQIDLSSGAIGVGSTIRWRGLYVKTSELSSQLGSIREFESNGAAAIDSTTDSDSYSNSRLSHFSPPQPMTQAELLRELLQPSKNTVH